MRSFDRASQFKVTYSLRKGFGGSYTWILSGVCRFLRFSRSFGQIFETSQLRSFDRVSQFKKLPIVPRRDLGVVT